MFILINVTDGISRDNSKFFGTEQTESGQFSIFQDGTNGIRNTRKFVRSSLVGGEKHRYAEISYQFTTSCRGVPLSSI